MENVLIKVLNENSVEIPISMWSESITPYSSDPSELSIILRYSSSSTSMLHGDKR